jgi:hypothetical protein
MANLFTRVPDNEAAYDALSRYGVVKTGAIFSNGSEGGYNLGDRPGVGSYVGITYTLSDPGRGGISQIAVYEAKKRNPNLVTLALHVEA